ncbi:hypothetical protein C1646_774901 [Rhizophagus diaphanus]|nr:hypothetical protein C1646_774901 [Rhizophagus diaphanus] [Rhizophagus sp. MUCL 43196]
MSNTQSNDSLKELNAKFLAEIGELKKKFAEIKVENDELKDKNIEIPELRRKFTEIETERTELKAKIAELLNRADSSAKNVRRDVEITEIKAEIVKLRDNNEENKELTFLQSDNISKEMVSENGQNNNTINLNTNTMNLNTNEAPFGNIQSLKDKETDDFLDEVHKKKISDEIRERKQKKKLHRESIAQDSLISHNIKTVPSGNDQSHVTSKTEVAVEQDNDMISEESLDENQIVEQGLIHELCSSLSSEDNVSSTEIISSCSKVDTFMADGRIKNKMARSMIYKEMKPFLSTKITQANLRKKTHRARKHLMLFGKNRIELDKIKLVSYSATEISKLTNAQIQNVIDQIKVETLDQYPNLYREFSSENFDYYGITDKTSCPLCKLKHDDEKSIESTYKIGSYFIKCEQHEIEIVA